MESFALFGNEDDDPYQYDLGSLSQLDLDLQQQAQAAFNNDWQDFMFLPQIDPQQPLFYAPTTPPQMNEYGFSDMKQPPQLQQQHHLQQLHQPLSPPLSLQPTVTTAASAATTTATAAATATANTVSAPTTTAPLPSQPIMDNTPVVPSQQQQQQQQQPEQQTWTPEPSDVKNEYPSPEHAPEKGGAMSPQPAFDLSQISWTVPASFEIQQQGKLPIQRLKSNNSPASQGNSHFPSGANITRATPPAAAGGQQKKTAHNAIERRYRNNINDRIAELKNAVPALLHARLKDSSRKRRTMDDDDDDGDDGEEYLDGVAVATKLNKATILRKATEYITHLKRTGDDMRQENALLQHLLAQLPGGQDVLSQYRMQKMQREQDMLQQQRLQQQQQQSASKRRKHQRKRTRTSDEDESSSSTAGSSPSTPPLGVSSRVFMAVFMAISLFSSSPLTSGPTSTEQFQNHHHMSRAATPDISTASTSHERVMTNSNATSGGLFDDVNGWAVIRTTVFVVCLVQLLLPLVKAWAGHMAYRVKRVPRRRRMFRKSGAALATASSANSVSPGDQKCAEVYRILVRQLAQEHDDGLPHSMLPIHLATESLRLAGRHLFGYEIYDERRDAQDEWEQACYWLKLCEIQALGGNPDATRWHRLYSCFRMLNLVEHLIDDEHAEVRTLRARAYVTAAMEFSLNGLSGRVPRYFWQQALIETSYMDGDDDVDENDGSFMWALMWKDYPHEDWIFDTLAWKETLEVMRGDRLSLSLTAPVIVPVTILSTLHLMESLKDQFRVLIKQITTSNDVVPGFDCLLAASEVQEQQRLAHWLAAVGMTVEALWKQDIKQAEHWMPVVARRVPRALLVALPGREVLAQKTRMNQVDELVKKQMILTLAGALALLQGTPQSAEEGISHLEEAERVRETMRGVRQSKVREYGIENAVMARAEFAVAMVGLDAWLRAWKWSKQDTRQQVRQATWHLRRMTKRSVLSEHQVLIDRLVRLDRFVARQSDGVDSACDCTEDEELEEPPMTAAVAYDLVIDDESIAKRADRALDILHGA